MAEYIRKNNNVSVFSSLMERFACPVAYGRDSEGNIIYETRYFNESPVSPFLSYNDIQAPGLLYYDPGWNLYQQTGTNGSGIQPGYESDMACMFVPTDEAINAYFAPGGEG